MATPATYPRTRQTTQVLIEVTGSTLVVPELAGHRVVVRSALLVAAASVLIEVWSGTTASPELDRLSGQMQMNAGVPFPPSVDTTDAVWSSRVGEGLTIRPLAAVVVAGTLSYYYERA